MQRKRYCYLRIFTAWCLATVTAGHNPKYSIDSRKLASVFQTKKQKGRLAAQRLPSTVLNRTQSSLVHNMRLRFIYCSHLECRSAP